MHQDEIIDVEAVVNELEQKIDRLKVLYEQYFMGIAKREPLVPLKDVVRLLHTLEQVQIRNTGVRYKLRTLVQRFNVYRTYWNRTLRAINNGTYHRDVARVSRKLSEQGVALPSTGRMRSVAELEQALIQAYGQAGTDGKAAAGEPSTAAAQTSAGQGGAGAINRPTVSTRTTQGAPSAVFSAADVPPYDPSAPAGTPAGGLAPPAAATPSQASPTSTAALQRPQQRQSPKPGGHVPATPPGSSGSSDIADHEIQSIYRRFIKAKQLCGEDTEAVRYENLAKSIRQQLPKIRQQNPGKEVEFQVVLRNGRAIIRAKTR